MIRHLKKNDEEIVLKIWLDASIIAHDFVSEYFWSEKLKDMREIYLPQSTTFVYIDNNQVVGFISLVENYIAAIFVAPNVQGKGFGTQLINYVKEKYKELHLGVYSKNRKSISFYLKHRFQIRGEKIESNTGELETIMVFKNE